jgi:PIN domain nuclease of toxin-antitoxin system
LDSVVVFDSSAVLAVIFHEVAGDAIVNRMRGALLSTVNLIEIHTKLLLRGASATLARQQVQAMQCDICSLDAEQAQIASEMIWKTRPFGLSLGDRACLALAIQRKAPVYTADRAWQGLQAGVEINVIR